MIEKRVLVVDDEAELAQVMCDMLRSAGFEVAMADSAGRALAMLESSWFDAIVLDFRMPDMDGAGMWHEIVTRHPAMAPRQLFVTGDTLSPNVCAFLDTSSCPYLDKPFAKADLIAAVSSIVTQARE